jgi:hypothetical protein
MTDSWGSTLLLALTLGTACCSDGRVPLLESSARVPSKTLAALELAEGHHLELQSFESGHILLIETISADRLAESELSSLAFDPNRMSFTKLYGELLARSNHVIAPVPGAMERLRAIDRQFAPPHRADPERGGTETARHFDYNISADFADDFRLLARKVCYASKPEADLCEVGLRGWEQFTTQASSPAIAMYNESYDGDDSASLSILFDPCAGHVDCDTPAKLIRQLSLKGRTLVFASVWSPQPSAVGWFTIEASGSHWGWAGTTR